MTPDSRYEKQILFAPIGVEGQARLSQSEVVLIGLGALGTVIANNLGRAGVGHLTLVDRDFVELSNLQRQVLFDEHDVRERMPKAVAAAAKLESANSQLQIDAVVADVSARNILELIGQADLVLDGTDNLETRFVINDACIKLGVPWIYGAALGAAGMTMTVVPGQTACLRCFIENLPAPGVMPSCDTEGVLAGITGAIASIQSVEALKLLTGSAPRPTLLYLDLWEGDVYALEVPRRPDCPACGRGDLQYLSGERTSWTTVLCGRNAVQIVPPEEANISLESLQQRLSRVANVQFNGFLLSAEVEGRELVLFPTGRAIIRGTTDEAEARGLYAKYVGT